jgi:hypothetical protein
MPPLQAGLSLFTDRAPRNAAYTPPSLERPPGSQPECRRARGVVSDRLGLVEVEHEHQNEIK